MQSSGSRGRLTSRSSASPRAAPSGRAIKAALERVAGESFDIPLVIGGKEVRTGRTVPLRRPDALGKGMGVYHMAGEAEATAACEAALAAKAAWEALPWDERAAVFLRAAELLTGKYRYYIEAATMLGQSKTVYQSEI